MKCEKCNREMIQVGSFVFTCFNCDDDNGGGICLVVE